MHFLSELLGMEPSAPGVSRTLKEKSVIQITFRIGFTSQKHEIKDDLVRPPGPRTGEGTMAAGLLLSTLTS